MIDDEIRRVASGLSVEISALEEAARRSARSIAVAQERLARAVPREESPFDVVVLGSLARMEGTEGSDFDFLLVAHKLPDNPKQSRDLMAAVQDARAELGFEKPGATGLFGCVVSAPDLTERIGLEADTNQTHSRRILLLEESRSIFQPALHKDLIRAIVERYLLDAEDRGRSVPRFLLNDVLRYWRTLTVDYEAKRWETLEQEWGLRYLKLRISRKLAFAGTLASIFLSEDPTPDYFVEQFLKPPLARLVQVHDRLEASLRDSLREVLSIANSFTASLDDRSFREEARRVSSRTQMAGPEAYRASRDDARRLQTALQAIFFDSELFGDLSRRYLAF